MSQQLTFLWAVIELFECVNAASLVLAQVSPNVLGEIPADE